MINSGHRRARPRSGWRRLWALLAVSVAGVVAVVVWTAPTASAHVIPSSTVQLAVHDSEIDATVTIPVSDVATATGLDLGDGAQTDIDAQAGTISAYLLDHIAPTDGNGRAWTVTIGPLAVAEAGDTATTGRYAELLTSLTLTPPPGTDDRVLDLGYTAVVDRVATHTVIVTVASDDARPDAGAYQLGVITRDTVTNTVTPLTVDLDGSSYQGFAGMVSTGMHHIAEGTDHQLFLLTLLLPAPLLVAGRRWTGSTTPRRAIRRIASVTLAFTLGHSLTLALGALGLPVPQGAVEAVIAVSILVAAVHAIRPIFPGREALVAGSFGLIHGLAFSETLRELDLTGSQLVSALLGFNLGIEAMQLIIVAVVLPPLIMLARVGRYRALRVTAAVITAVAALGWLAARLGHPNPVSVVADQLGLLSIPVVVALWVAAVVVSRMWWPTRGGAGVREDHGKAPGRVGSRSLVTARRASGSSGRTQARRHPTTGDDHGEDDEDREAEAERAPGHAAPVRRQGPTHLHQGLRRGDGAVRR